MSRITKTAIKVFFCFVQKTSIKLKLSIFWLVDCIHLALTQIREYKKEQRIQDIWWDEMYKHRSVYISFWIELVNLFRYNFQSLQFTYFQHCFIGNWVSWLNLYFSEVSLVVFFLLEWVWLCHFISRFSLYIPCIHIETITNVLHDWIFRCMKKRKCKQPFIIHSNNKYTANNRIWNTTN